MELRKFDRGDKVSVVGNFIVILREGCRVTENKSLAFIRDFSERKSIKYLSDHNLYFSVRMVGEFISRLEEQLKDLRNFEKRHDEAAHIENEKKHEDNNKNDGIYGRRSAYG